MYAISCTSTGNPAVSRLYQRHNRIAHFFHSNLSNKFELHDTECAHVEPLENIVGR